MLASGGLNVNLILGPILCGAFLTIFLFGIACLQTVNYLKTFPNDLLYVKCTVLFLWTIELAYTVCVCQGVYTMAVTDFGQFFALLYTPWGLNVGVILGAIIDHCVQAFFVFRIFRATRALYLCTFLWTMVAVLQALSLYLAVESLRTDSIAVSTSDPKYHPFLLSLFFGDATMDLVNAAVLCFHLRKQRQFAFSRSTTAIVDRLVVYTLQTGLATSVVAFAAAISIVVAPHEYLWTTFFLAMPCTFMNALLANINNRNNLTSAKRKHSIHSSSGETHSSGSRGPQVHISRSIVFAPRDTTNTTGTITTPSGKAQVDIIQQEEELGEMELNKMRENAGYDIGPQTV
ncbi:hypothetical protein C8F01DRAFT_1136296 [Mycena amicta]|nr:hypothetical protein C8F01DRAFT_1136296 [Mycena amicta]